MAAPLPIPATPAAVLAEWKATATPDQLAALAPHRAAVLAWLTALPTPPERTGINVDLEDVRPVLRGAGASWAGQAAAGDTGRAGAALRQLLTGLPSLAGVAAHRAVLLILSGSAEPLEMDELVEVTKAMHSTVLHNE